MIHFSYCYVSISPVRSESKDQSEIVTQLLFGELVRVIEIKEPWCKIVTESDGYSGYVDIKHLNAISDKEARHWSEGLVALAEREMKLHTPNGLQYICRGSYIKENAEAFNIGEFNYTFDSKPSKTFSSATEIAMDFLNTPYLWGGKSPFGIDCSGLTQICFRIKGFNLPRDAHEQAEGGMVVDFDNHQEDDIAFFANSSGKIIHVGILNGNGEIIHAAGHVRKDKFTRGGIIHNQTKILTHNLTKIIRL